MLVDNLFVCLWGWTGRIYRYNCVCLEYYYLIQLFKHQFTEYVFLHCHMFTQKWFSPVQQPCLNKKVVYADSVCFILKSVMVLISCYFFRLYLHTIIDPEDTAESFPWEQKLTWKCFFLWDFKLQNAVIEAEAFLQWNIPLRSRQVLCYHHPPFSLK